MARRPKPITRWKRGRYQLEVAGLVLLKAVARLFPRGMVRWAGERLGDLMFYLIGYQRRVGLANLAVAFGDALSPGERRRLARRSFANAFGTMFGLLWAERLRQVDVRRFVENPEAIQAFKQRATGRGLILLTLHYGDWELLGLAVGACGLRPTVIARETPNQRLAQQLGALRSVTGNEVIPQHRALQRLFQVLRRGEVVALLADLNARRKTGGVWVKFFGLPVFNHSSVAALALRTGADIGLLVAEPVAGGRVRIHSAGFIPHAPTGDDAQDVQRLSQLCSEAGEAIIRARPEYWLWSYRRWRHRPTPEQGRYPFYSSHKDMGISPPP